MWRIGAILNFKMAAQDDFEKNGTNSDIVVEGIKIPEIIGSTNVAKTAPILQITMYYTYKNKIYKRKLTKKNKKMIKRKNIPHVFL